MRNQHFCLVLAVAIVFAATSCVAAAPEDDPIQKSIKRAVGYLKSIHQPGPGYRGGSYGTGTAPLVGLALLEAGVPESDPALKNIIYYVREHALAQTRTYEVSLAILFLDRLGHPGDRPIIQLLGVRLLAGQELGGGWTYDCGNALSSAEEARLKKVFLNENKLANKPLAAKMDMPPVEPMPNKDGEKPELHPEVAKWGKLVNKMAGGGEKFGIGRGDGDNSNTQFAMLAVWTARKHGVACDGAIASFERRFRLSQSADGSWGYIASFNPPLSCKPAMTCAGLVALAVAHGAMDNALKNNPANGAPAKGRAIVDVGDDVAIKAAIKYIGSSITTAKGQQPEGVINPARRAKRFRADELNSNLYFLWSLERVAVLYGLETIGNHDWYVWGSDALIDNQLNNGSWGSRSYHGANNEVNTAFAVLFLSRANIARDLSVALKGKVKDPGVAVLRGGGEIAKILPKQDAPKPEPKVNVEVLKPEPKEVVVLPKPEPKPNIEVPRPVAKNVSDASGDVALARALLNVSDDGRTALISRYRDEKGSAYTDAIALAATKWTGDAQREAREALAKRLTRMKAVTLSAMLKDDDREIRRAAALACGAKDDKACIADLIETLRDNEEIVVQAAHSSLRGLTAQDFGPKNDASAGEKLKAVVAWRNWWKTQMR